MRITLGDAVVKIERENTKKGRDDRSELRQDLLTGEWVVIAKKRGKRPDQFVSDEERQVYDPNADPFSHPEETGQEPDTLIYRDHTGEWTTRVIPNKFPAVDSEEDPEDRSHGPYRAMSGYGMHEIIVTRDGDRPYALLKQQELAEVLDAYTERYHAHMRKKGIRSVNIFHNHGKKAGASVIHPHSQIIALPVVSHAVMQEIIQTDQYYKRNHVSAFSVLLSYERNNKDRFVCDNGSFLAYCPFASERAFQIRIIPKKPQAYFERITLSQQMELAEVLSKSLRALHEGLNDPSFNFYIRTAPCDGSDYPHYSWHIDIFPRTHIHAGFEFSTDIEIVPITPEDAAVFLRGHIPKEADA